MGAQEIFSAGNLAEALAAAKDEVRSEPANAARRGLLSALLCFAGDFERADRQLDAIAGVDPSHSVGVALVRHLIRAEQARVQCHTEGRLPEFLAPPSANVRLQLEAWIRIREGKLVEAAAMLANAEDGRTHVAGVHAGAPFDDFRDLDDATASFFEVLTSNGKYYWVPFEQIESLEFHPPKDAWDLLWRRVRMVVRGGPDGEVYVPVLYFGSHVSPDDRLKLGRATDWRGGGDSPVRGVGQRTFLVGDGDLGILELGRVELRAGC